MTFGEMAFGVMAFGKMSRLPKFVGTTILLTNPTIQTVGTAQPFSLRRPIQFVALVCKQTAKHSLPACRPNKQNDRLPQICCLFLHAVQLVSLTVSLF